MSGDWKWDCPISFPPPWKSRADPKYGTDLVRSICRYTYYTALMRKLINVDVLIIDDFLTMSIDLRGQEDLTKIVIERDGRLPTIIASQSTAAYWAQTMPNRIAAESLVSRLNTGLRIDIGDYDMRKALSHPTN